MARRVARGCPTPHRGVRAALRWGVAAFWMVGGCESQPPALEVGPLGFSDEALGALGPAQQRSLADLAAFGLAVADGRTGPLIQPQIERDLRSLVVQRLALELAADRAGLGDPELRLAYDRNPRHELVVRHLVVLSERWRPVEHRDSARARAAEARRRAVAGEPFDALAGEYSDEPGAAERGGLLEPGRAGSWVPEFWQAASSLAEGEVSRVVETEFGFHVIQLVDRKRVPFEDVREEVLREVMALPVALERAADWAERRLRAARIDTGAVRGWMEGSDEVGAVARWPDSLAIPALGASELGSYGVATAGAGSNAVREEGPDEALARVEAAARTHMMVHEAGRRGIEPTPSQSSAIRERWQSRLAGWGATLGFERGQSEERVKQQALELIGAPEQSVAIARSELAGLRPRLRELYPVTLPADSTR